MLELVVAPVESRASHGCMTTRGVHAHGAAMVTRRLLEECAREPYRSDILKALSASA